MKFEKYNKKLGELEYDGTSELVIDLLNKDECRKYKLPQAILDDKFIKRFELLECDKPYFDTPREFTNKLLNNKKVYQAKEGKVILSRLVEGERLGVTKRKPVGWHHNFIVDKGNYFYHKTHILGDQLVKKRVSYIGGGFILGTRFLNAAPTGQSMKTYEDKIRDKLSQISPLKIYYCVTPIFRNDEVVPRGVRMTAKFGKESNQEDFDVFIFNAYPGYHIKYDTGCVKKISRN